MPKITARNANTFTKYTELAWASYSTRFNKGMFGDDDKKWGLNKEGNYFNEKDAEQNKQITYKKALTNGIVSFYNDTRTDFTNNQATIFVNRYKILAFVKKVPDFLQLYFMMSKRMKLYWLFAGLIYSDLTCLKYQTSKDWAIA